jgi:hypothetical protein
MSFGEQIQTNNLELPLTVEGAVSGEDETRRRQILMGESLAVKILVQCEEKEMKKKERRQTSTAEINATINGLII